MAGQPQSHMAAIVGTARPSRPAGPEGLAARFDRRLTSRVAAERLSLAQKAAGSGPDERPEVASSADPLAAPARSRSSASRRTSINFIHTDIAEIVNALSLQQSVNIALTP